MLSFDVRHRSFAFATASLGELHANIGDLLDKCEGIKGECTSTALQSCTKRGQRSNYISISRIVKVFTRARVGSGSSYLRQSLQKRRGTPSPMLIKMRIIYISARKKAWQLMSMVRRP
jgi:hypothetical protein